MTINEIAQSNTISASQKRAIFKASSAKEEILKKYPGLAKKYKKYTIPQLIKEYKIMDRFNLSYYVSFAALYMLITDVLGPEQKQKNRKKHMAKIGSKRGKLTKKQKKGIFARSKKQRIKDAGEGGKKGWFATYKQGKGFCNRTPEKMKKDALKGVRTRGQIPWVEEKTKRKAFIFAKYTIPSEVEFAYSLSNLPNYSLEQIAQEVNNKYHKGKNIRNRMAIAHALTKLKKTKKQDGLRPEIKLLYILYDSKRFKNNQGTDINLILQQLNSAYPIRKTLNTYKAVDSALSRYKKLISANNQ